jgi:transcription elongation factor Elf1
MGCAEPDLQQITILVITPHLLEDTKQMTMPDMRWSARECVVRAKTLLANGDEPSARYACLELRSAIEYIVYNQVQTYRDELPYDVIKKWQPRELIGEMLRVDPLADCSSTLSFTREAAPGVTPEPSAEGWKSLGEDHRLEKGWAVKKHNTLGNYLHAPTIHQLESGTAPPLETIIARATEVLQECEQVLSSKIFNGNFGEFFWFNCGDCKTQMRVRIHDPNQKQVVTCRQCGAKYDAEFDEEQKVGMSPYKANYTCPVPCEGQNEVWIHRIVEGAIFTCKKCGKRVTVIYQLVDADAEG